MAEDEKDRVVGKASADVNAGNDDIGHEIGDDDLSTTKLRRVPAPIPWILFLICVVEVSDR